MKNNKILQLVLYPFSLIYGFFVWIRVFLYQKGILKGYYFDLPIIKIGNLNLGGTGKSPMVIYINKILSEDINTAILSRGYKRKTRGLVIANRNSSPETIGDEPLLFKLKFPNTVVAVKESRAEAIPEILAKNNNIECFILDDAFQHLSLENGLNILLSSYEDPFYDDFILPAGRLREMRSAYKRADIIIITKSPENICDQEKQEMVRKVNPTSKQKVYFSYLDYSYPYYLFNTTQTISLQENYHVLLLAAIADTKPMEKYVLSKVEAVYRQYYDDHHQYNEEDIKTILKSFNNIENKNKLIITTEKDAVRLFKFRKTLVDQKIPIFILPVEHNFSEKEKNNFNDQIINFVYDYLGKEKDNDPVFLPEE